MQLAIPFPDISPVLVEIPLGFTSLPIRWYALAYIVGIVLGYQLAKRTLAKAWLWKDDTPPMAPARLEDFLTWLILGIILGGRIGYVLFYGQGQFWEDPLSIIRVWEGGMAFHGGFLGFIVATALFAHSRSVSALSLLDVAAASVPFGLFFLSLIHI